MTESRLKSLVAQAVSLDREIADKTEALKALKAELVQEAQSRPDEQVATDGGGTSITFAGHDGCVASVAFPAPTLKAKIDGEGKAIEKVKAVAGRVFDRLFRPAIAFRPVDNFREEAAALLGKDASKLIKLCQSESAPRVSFETKEATEA